MAKLIYTEDNNLRLERWRNAVKVKIPYKCADTLELQKKSFDFDRQYAIIVGMSIITENISQLKYPANWWEALKEKLLSLFKWLPLSVRYNDINVCALYPNLSFKDEKVIFRGQRVINGRVHEKR